MKLWRIIILIFELSLRLEVERVELVMWVDWRVEV